MPMYQYKAVASSGKSTRGIIDAASPSDARARLRKEGIFLTEIAESKADDASSLPGNVQITGRVSLQDVTIMTRQLSTLVSSGIPLVESLTALLDQVENLKLKRTLSDVREKVNEGSSLAEAMRSHPRVFSNLFVNMVRAGEASGALGLVLNRLADYTENQSRLRGKIVSTLAYPAIMLIIGLIAMVGIFTFVIPKVMVLYEDMGHALPLPTRVLIGTTNFFTSYWYVVLLATIAFLFLFRGYLRTPGGRKRFDRFLLHMPIFGPVFRMVAIARFANTFSTLLASGVPILVALDIVKNVLNNAVLSEVIEKVRTNISEGDSIAEPLRRSGEFPPLVTHMIAIGEKTGEVEAMLHKVSETYNNQVDARVSTMTSLIEPLLIVFMAGIIGSIVISVMLPLLDMPTSI